MSPSIRVAAIIAGVVLIGVAFGQTSTGSAPPSTIIRIYGQVLDHRGAPLASALVRLRVASSGETTVTTTTNSTGKFEFAVAPRPYELSVEAAAFLPFRRRLGRLQSSDVNIGIVRLQLASFEPVVPAAPSEHRIQPRPASTVVSGAGSATFSPPPDLIAALQSNPAVRECLPDVNSRLSDVVRITPLYLSPGERTVLVQGRIPCLAGNDNGSIFVYLYSGDAWQKILDVNGNRLERAATRTDGWRDLVLWQHDNAFRGARHLYRFDGSQYNDVSCNIVQFSDQYTGRRLPKPVYSSCTDEFRVR
ncbi:MAG: carboxypeptidase-like regulatory domain-containing protein [Bryobacteraceae bacterium]